MRRSSRATAPSGPLQESRRDEDDERNDRAVFWRINGFRARLLIWSLQEWETLDVRPSDAQYHPSGVWCALRMDWAAPAPGHPPGSCSAPSGNAGISS